MVFLPTPKYPDVTQGSPGVVWLVLGLHHGDSHIQGSRCRGQVPKDGYVPRKAIGDLRVATLGVPVEWS